MLVTVMIVAAMLLTKEENRNLSTVREMITDPVLYAEVIKQLQALGDIPACPFGKSIGPPSRIRERSGRGDFDGEYPHQLPRQ